MPQHYYICEKCRKPLRLTIAVGQEPPKSIPCLICFYIKKQQDKGLPE